MTRLMSLHNSIFGFVDRYGSHALPIFARFVFAATLLMYFWRSAVTKLGDGILGIFRPSAGAYTQMFPKAMEAVSWDVSQLSVFYWLVALFGTWAEFILPLLIVLGLATRLASIGMIGFVLVQSLTDIYAHGATDAQTLGAWFDKASNSVILDQRLFWVFVLVVLIVKGAGFLSLDALLRRKKAPGLI